jgi:hypothetical protein
MQPYTITRREDNGKIHVKNISKIHVESETLSRTSIRIRNQVKSMIWIRKNHSRSTTELESFLLPNRPSYSWHTSPAPPPPQAEENAIRRLLQNYGTRKECHIFLLLRDLAPPPTTY